MRKTAKYAPRSSLTMHLRIFRLRTRKSFVSRRPWWDSHYYFFHLPFLALENELDVNRRKVQGLINETHRKGRELSRLRDNLEKVKRKNPFNGVAQAGEKIVEQSHPEQIFSASINGSTPIYRSTGRYTVTPHSTHNQIPFRSQSSGPHGGPIVPPLFSGTNVGASNSAISDNRSAERRFRAPGMAANSGRGHFWSSTDAVIFAIFRSGSSHRLPLLIYISL